MGDIRITFDDHDEVEQWTGNPIYLNNLVQEGLILYLITDNRHKIT